MTPATHRLYIAAKAPRVGFVKTRLGAAIGPGPAAALYRAFLKDLAVRFADAPFPLGWYVTPADAWRDLEPIVGMPDGALRVLDQGQGDWTTRQRWLFQGAPGRGEARIVLTASDSPHMPIEVVADAFRQLDRHDVVLGPVHDGGYYLIGMRGWHDVLRDIPMSTTTVFDQIVERTHRLGLSLGLVEGTFDVDDAADLPCLLELVETRDDLSATRAAVREIGLSRLSAALS